MSLAQREQVATLIRAWSDGARALADRSTGQSVGLESNAPSGSDDRAEFGTALAIEAMVERLLGELQRQRSMARLVDLYISTAGGWPVGLPSSAENTSDDLVRQVVAASYWRRYQQMLAEATARVQFASLGRLDDERGAQDIEAESEELDSSARPGPAGKPMVDVLGASFGRIELAYTVKFWERGPLRLRALPLERRPRYDALVQIAYQRVASCRGVRELAAHYFSDGEWLLRFGQEELAAVGEPMSNAGWLQEAACWQRYQELVEASRRRRSANSTPAPIFAVWLAAQMTRRRLSVAELAHRLGLLEEPVRAWLAARAWPTSEHYRRLAATLGVAESQLPGIGEAVG